MTIIKLKEFNKKGININFSNDKIINKVGKSTPGIIKKIKITPNTDYIINFEGYSEKENVRLWIGGFLKKKKKNTKKRGTYYYEIDHKLTNENKQHQFYFYSFNIDVIFIGFLFSSSSKINDTFHIKNIEIKKVNNIDLLTDINQKIYLNNKQIQKVKNNVCLIATYKRHNILRLNIKCLYPQLKTNGAILLILSCYDDIIFIEKLKEENNYENLYYSYFPFNHPLGRKWQYGVFETQKFKPKMILINGSDDLVSKNYIKVCLKNLKNYDLIGVKEWLLYHNNKLYFSKYIIENFKPLGAGRVFNTKFLNKINWKIYDTNIDKGLDQYAYTQLIKNNGKLKIIFNNYDILSVKGSWDVLTKFDKIKKHKFVKIKFGLLKNKNILNKKFNINENEIINL